jgi:predicted RND superfamily exporter protein
VLALFFVSLIMIPSILYWLPVPTEKHLKHLNFPIIGAFLRIVDLTVHRHRPIIYLISLGLAVFAVYGMLQLRSISYMVDDVPEQSQVKKDMKFFETNF